VTHNLDIVAGTDRMVRLVDGQVEHPSGSSRVATRGLKIAE
jgi:hypothetical protein